MNWFQHKCADTACSCHMSWTAPTWSAKCAEFASVIELVVGYYYSLQTVTIFLRSDATATIYFAARFVQLLFEVGIYFFGNPGDINDGWLRYIRVRRWWLLDTVSSTRSLSVLLSAVGMTRTTQTVLALAWWPSSEIICTRVRVLRLLAAATIRGWRLFCSWKSFRLCGYYLRAATIQGRRLFEGGDYSRVTTIWGRRLFEGGGYSRVMTIRRPRLFEEMWYMPFV